MLARITRRKPNFMFAVLIDEKRVIFVHEFDLRGVSLVDLLEGDTVEVARTSTSAKGQRGHDVTFVSRPE